MSDPAPRRRPPTRWRVLVLVAAAILLTGCELATGTVRTATQLRDAGIRNPDLHYDNGVATLRYDADPNPLEARAEQDRAATIIWRNLPFRIDRITVVADGAFPNRRDYPRALLEQQLGPRPARLDRSVADIARRATLIAVAVALVLLVLIVVVILLVVRAVRRQPTPQPAGWPQGGTPPPPGQPWGPPPPGQPWGQPPPGQQPWGQAPPPPQPWGQPAPPPPRPAPQPPPAPPPGQAGGNEDWPSGAPRPEAPPRGPGDTQRLEPEPPPEERGPTPPG